MIKIHITDATFEIITDNDNDATINEDKIAEKNDCIAALEHALKEANIQIQFLENKFSRASEPVIASPQEKQKQRITTPEPKKRKISHGVTEKKVCLKCNKEYQPSGNSQKYCTDCHPPKNKTKKQKPSEVAHEPEHKKEIVFPKITRSCATCKYESLCKTSRKCKPNSVEFFETKN
jgi:uncharacterized coiled-coil protein SlyX